MTVNHHSPISLMLRDGILHYAYASKQTGSLTINHCAWPKGLSDSALPPLLAKRSHIQYIIPPESVRIIHLDRPSGIRDKGLLDYARIELLNYIDTPIEEMSVTLLNPSASEEPILTAQVVVTQDIATQLDQLREHGVEVNRVTLPDGGFSDMTNTDSHATILALDAHSPRVVRCHQGVVTHIQTLPKSKQTSDEALCPTMTASVEQWIRRHASSKQTQTLSILAASDKLAEEWVAHLTESMPIPNLSYTTFSSLGMASSFADRWVALAASHYAGKKYRSFDLCWAKGRRLLSTGLLYTLAAGLVISLACITLQTTRSWQKLSSLKQQLTHITTGNTNIQKALGHQKNAVLGIYTPKKIKQNKQFLSGWHMLSSRAFPGLWIDTLTIKQGRMTIIGSSASVTLLHDYSDWLKTQAIVKSIGLNRVTPDQQSNREFNRSLKTLNKKIMTTEKNAKRRSGKAAILDQKKLQQLVAQRNLLLLSDQQDTPQRFSFNITVTLR